MSLDTRILAALREANADSVSGSELARQLGVTRAAIWTRIQELRALGYDIPAEPHQGYRLLSSPDLLHADDLTSRLGPTRAIGLEIKVFNETSSTSDIVDKLARADAPEGVVVFAESQTRGRGRLGRRWASPPGKGLWFSTLLRPAIRPLEATKLTVAAGAAVARSIRSQTGLAAEVKWPNDILIGGKKAAGILTEMSAELDSVRFVVLGIGVNVNMGTSDLPSELRKAATSLKIESGKAQDRPQLAVALLRELDRAYAMVCEGQFAAVAEEWESLCTTLGRMVTIRVGDRKVQGRAEALDGDGALLVRTQHGHLEQILSGDVSLER